jgi:polyribonucleotide nucleotidyltransferase
MADSAAHAPAAADVPAAAPAPNGNVWAAKAALREKEREVERKKEEEKKRAAAAAKPAFTAVEESGGRKDQQPADKPRRDLPSFAGAEGEIVTDGQHATMWIRVKQDYAGFIVGPLGKVINEIAQQTGAHILSPRKGDESIFFLSGAKPCVKAAAALIRVKEQEGKEREKKGHQQPQEPVSDTCTVPESLVGFVMGSQRAVITNISHQTRTKITCPVRGGKPEFGITGTPICVEAAKACIEAKVQHAAMVSWQVAQEHVTIQVTVGVEKVGLVVGPQGTVIQNIAITTGTSIISPRKGQDPVFIITGPKCNVEAARQVIESKTLALAPGAVPARGGKGGGGKGGGTRVDAMNRPVISDGLARGAPP